MSKPGGCHSSGISLGDALRLPKRHPAWRRRKLNLAVVRNVRTWPAMPREKAQAAPTARPKVLMRRRGADCPVVVLKRGNARGAKGGGSSPLRSGQPATGGTRYSMEGGSLRAVARAG